jgi:S-adenosylmethionine synthetase
MDKKRYLFSSESVTEGHPDKVCDSISDAVLDACLAQDPHSRVACEALAKSNLVVVAGEITTQAHLDYTRIVRDTIREIGYTKSVSPVFNDEDCFLTCAVVKQSPDIAQGVDAREAEGKGHAEQGAGDQGLMFGFACTETPQLMPAPIMYAHNLGKALRDARKSGRIPWLRPDGKTQVTVEYEGYRPLRVHTVVISNQHAADVKHKEICEVLIEEIIKKVIPPEMLDGTRYLINPTGRFVIGGPEGDSGLTGRKIIVDTYGGMGRHGGGAFSGKDPSKVDRSAAYMGRYVAKNIVAAGLAERCELQFAYAIGHPEPVSLLVETFGTGRVAPERIEKAVKEVFSFKPANIIRQLNLLRPIYSKTTNYGHFGKTSDLDSITWERTDMAETLKQAV